MKYSELFGKTKKEIGKKFEAKNQELLLRAGFIDQVGSGIYTLLPLGKRVLDKIDNIIREEMDKIGGQEISMPLLHPRALWRKTGRWDSFDALFKTKSRYGGAQYALAPTHEEIVTPLVAKFVQSYRDLPVFLYHLTPKFRDEPRPKSGILRGREFGMKDLYSFHSSHQDLEKYYEKVKKAYLSIFSRCGLADVKVTEASGGTFTQKFSHEFNVITPAGEVDLIYCQNCSFAQNKEVAKVEAGDSCPQCSALLKKARAIEVGNIFDLGDKFAKDFDLQFIDQDGKKKYPVMGCYGIGDTRLLGTIVEVYHDEEGIIWPGSVAPYQIHLVNLVSPKSKVQSPKSRADKIYVDLIKAEIEVLYDDRENVSAGEKFADADLIGIPVRLLLSEKTGEKIEWKGRKEKKGRLLTFKQVLKRLCQKASRAY